MVAGGTSQQCLNQGRTTIAQPDQARCSPLISSGTVCQSSIHSQGHLRAPTALCSTRHHGSVLIVWCRERGEDRLPAMLWRQRMDEIQNLGQRDHSLLRVAVRANGCMIQGCPLSVFIVTVVESRIVSHRWAVSTNGYR